MSRFIGITRRVSMHDARFLVAIGMIIGFIIGLVTGLF